MTSAPLQRADSATYHVGSAVWAPVPDPPKPGARPGSAGDDAPNALALAKKKKKTARWQRAVVQVRNHTLRQR